MMYPLSVIPVAAISVTDDFKLLFGSIKLWFKKALCHMQQAFPARRRL